MNKMYAWLIDQYEIILGDGLGEYILFGFNKIQSSIKRAFILLMILLVGEKGFAQINDPNKTSTICFKVDQVKIAKRPLHEQPITTAFNYKLQKKIRFVPPEQKDLNIVATMNNAFIQTVQNCYDEHRPLILSPDIIWLQICQGVSIHINDNFDRYKSLLFKGDYENKIAITERDDSLSFDKDNWSSIITKISKDANEYVNKDFYSFFVPPFSTTTPINKTVFEITMLEAFKKKFVYKGESGCGIPSISIKGSTEDWQWIYNHLSQLNTIGLEQWADELKPIILQFIETSKGKVDQPFWKDIYKNAVEYNAYFISGWIIKFFPYLADVNFEVVKDTSLGGYSNKFEIQYKPNPFIYKKDYLKSTLSTTDFPSGVAKIDFKWNDYIKHQINYLQFYAGFMGIKQFSDKSLEPFISWAITDTTLINTHTDSRYDSAVFILEEENELKHKVGYWSPHFAKKVTDSAVFDIKRFKTTANSLRYVRQLILDSLEHQDLFDKKMYQHKKVAIEILCDGSLGAIHLLDSTISEQLERPLTTFELYLKKVLASQKEGWFPAIAHPSEFISYLYDDYAIKKERLLKVKANSKVVIEL